ncbi:arf-GAP with Rho-GAP domain, ANK repeat and PH domain-containing protein 1-like isoform X3 [Dreissena polymorpha]|uniref:arf-GAP with Rho-GAP domain, ANK repeat and PH domain-containing protein 1-like isoform X3 n=1 Tax=Dreissena polymorpha TaxID=45954 RepID=UPI002263BF1B|nr:arf-GAP with Rho-GAP domain, ANK repeat and PH domain-containing protein 1-like isoform X3 [Dreissena polymorpha]
MSDPHPLCVWLESINLPQYVQVFTDYGCVTRKQCLSLDKETLEQIGVMLPGHQKRILNHLPSVDSDTWPSDKNSVGPLLPPKTKYARDNDDEFETSGEHSNFPEVNSTSSPPPQASEPSLCPKPKPRPSLLPKPKSDLQSPSDESPRPLTKPRPAPRSRASSYVPVKESPSKVRASSYGPPNATTDTCTLEDNLPVKEKELPSWTYGEDDIYSNSNLGSDLQESFNNGLEALKTEKHSLDWNVYSPEINIVQSPETTEKKMLALSLEGACVDESADSMSKDLYIHPNKRKNKGNDDAQTYANDNLFQDGMDLESDEIYVNLGEEKYDEYKVKTVKNKPHTLSEETKLTSVDEFDPLSVGFQTGSATFKTGSNSHQMTSAGSHVKSTHSSPKISTQVSSDSDIYEPIWKEKGHNPNTNEHYRQSNLMQFSPFPEEFSDTRTKTHDRTSLYDNRNSTSFDMPPPSFAPPPLPTSTESCENDETIHSALTQPPVPPRPPNYKAPKFQPYANVQFYNLNESYTLPGTDCNMEPDIPLNSPQYLECYSDANVSCVADDPFSNDDPFGEFKPDMDDDTFPNPCSTSDSTHFEFGKTLKGKSTAKKSDFMYEMASAIQEPFDPFGLHKQKGGSTVARSGSSASSGSNHRLSQVVPPPSLGFTFPKDSWDNQPSYMLAKPLEDDDHSSVDSVDDMLSPGEVESEHGELMSPVEILPTALSPRKRERSGYLYKQGGVQRNRGWQKRWVIFDGKTLRYFSSAKDQVSKRIVPLSCMKNVEIDVRLKDMVAAAHVRDERRPSNARQYKFRLQCTNRTFLFATDNLDDCKMWSSTLMESILANDRAPDKNKGNNVVEKGGEMANPDIEGWMKINRNRYKFYVALKEHRLCYYQSKDDFNMASPLHEIQMGLSSVKEIDRTRLQLNTHYGHFSLHFETSSEASNWKMAIEEAITDALGDNTILDQVIENPVNKKCADCGMEGAHWASMNLGLVLCMHCAGIHRGFDYRLSKVRSLRMDTKVWNSSLIEMFKVIGNENGNQFWLHNLPPGAGITSVSTIDQRKQFIHEKYKDKKYCNLHHLAGDKQKLNEELLATSITDDILLTYQVLLSGAEVLYSSPDQPNYTAYDRAKDAHQRIQMEFLLQNGGDRTRNFVAGSNEEAALNARLRAEVQKQGFLMKTGSNKKDFLKRHCVLEHGHLSYYVSEASKVEKDRIDNESILCVQSIPHDKQVGCFEISTNKENNRVYLFAASSDEERLGWMQSIAQVCCPVKLMDSMRTKSFSLAGYTHLKTALNVDWQRTWFVLEGRKLLFVDEGEPERSVDVIDLRRVTSITKITQGIDSCKTCLETGFQFLMKVRQETERMLYFQADLVRDTGRMFGELEHAVKYGGDTIEDQVLTVEEIPVIVETCVTFIAQFGMKVEGIYRKADQESKINNLLQKFREDARSVVLRLDEVTVYMVSNTLKRFFRMLREPVFTSDLYKRWCQTANETDHNTKLQWYKYLLQQLPRINYLTIKYFVIHLYKVSLSDKENAMTIANLATVTSSMMVSDSVTDPTNPPRFPHLQIQVMTDIITYHEWLFELDNKEEKDPDGIARKRLEALMKNNRTTDDILVPIQYLSNMGKIEMVKSTLVISKSAGIRKNIKITRVRDIRFGVLKEKITKDTTADTVVRILRQTLNLKEGSWALHEIVKDQLERFLPDKTKLWPQVHQWQTWVDDYTSSARLCLCPASQLKQKLQQAYDPRRTLVAELYYAPATSSKKILQKSHSKVMVEFKQAVLSYSKNASKVECSWNIENLVIYNGCDPKKKPPKEWEHCFSFYVNDGHKMAEKDLFGHTVFFTSEKEKLMWMAALLNSQSPLGAGC